MTTSSSLRPGRVLSVISAIARELLAQALDLGFGLAPGLSFMFPRRFRLAPGLGFAFPRRFRLAPGLKDLSPLGVDLVGRQQTLSRAGFCRDHRTTIDQIHAEHLRPESPRHVGRPGLEAVRRPPAEPLQSRATAFTRGEERVLA